MPYRLTLQAQQEMEEVLTESEEGWGKTTAENLHKRLRKTFERIGGWERPGTAREKWADEKYIWVPLVKYPFFVVWSEGNSREDCVIVRIISTSQLPDEAMRETQDWS